MGHKLFLVLSLLGICHLVTAKNSISAEFGCHAPGDTARYRDLPILFNLPNAEWTTVVHRSPGVYFFKRNPITDSAGRHVIPAIMIYAEDAAGYRQDITIFTSKKMQPLLDRGVTTAAILSWQDKSFPLSFKNALFARGTYSDGQAYHIIFMVYVIDKHDKGFQVYLDITKEPAPKYEAEFWTTIRSLREMP